MKKNILTVFALILFAAMLTSCGLFVTPVAYTRFKTSPDRYVYYSSVEVLDQIQVFDSEEDFQNEDRAIVFDFVRCLGRDELDGVYYTLVDVKDPRTHLYVTVYKDSEMYGSSKMFYLNGSPIVADEIVDEEGFKAFIFNNLSLDRTNSKGYIDPEVVNYFEYK